MIALCPWYTVKVKAYFQTTSSCLWGSIDVANHRGTETSKFLERTGNDARGGKPSVGCGTRAVPVLAGSLRLWALAECETGSPKPEAPQDRHGL